MENGVTFNQIRPPSFAFKRASALVPADDTDPVSGSCQGDVRELHKDICTIFEEVNRIRRRLAGWIGRCKFGPGSDADRDLIHLAARMDGFMQQASHAVMLVERLPGGSAEPVLFCKPFAIGSNRSGRALRSGRTSEAG